MSEHRSILGAMRSRLGLGSVALAAGVAVIAALTVARVSAEPPTEQDYFGVVVSLGQDTLVINVEGATGGTLPGPSLLLVDIPISGDTQVRLPQKRDAQIADLAEGDLVAVTLEVKNGVLTAAKVFVIPGKTQHRHIPGEVTALSDSQITIQPVAEVAGLLTFARNASTTLRTHKSAPELRVGAFVIIVAARNPLTGELLPHALEIHVVPRESGKPQIDTSKSESPSRESRVEIEGVLQGFSTSTSRWTIDGREVEVGPSTKVQGAVAVGNLVEVDGVLREDGSVLAVRIVARQRSQPADTVTRIEGTFEGVDAQGNWIISGTKVAVGPRSDTDGLPALGQRVEVKALLRPDGSLLAREIENKRGPKAPKEKSREVKFEGLLQGIGADGTWTINGAKVAVGPLTKVKGAPAVGALVVVEGLRQESGVIAATSVQARGKDSPRRKSEVEIAGRVQKILDDGTIVVRGISVGIDPLTEIEGTPTVGEPVQIKAFLAEDGRLVAREVESKGKDEADEAAESSEVEIEGTIERVNADGTFVLSGIIVATSTLSEIKGELAAGARVKVEGVFQEDGTLLAGEVKGEGRRATSGGNEVKHEGLIEKVNRDGAGRIVSVVVNGLTIKVEPLTRVEGRLVAGAKVDVSGIVSKGGFLAGRLVAHGKDKEKDKKETPAGSRPSEVRIDGVIESFATSTAGIASFQVNGLVVEVDARTKIHTEIKVGSVVNVVAFSTGGRVVASNITGRKPLPEKPATSAFNIKGRVQSVARDADNRPVSVVVDGTTISIEPLTRVHGTLEPGVEVVTSGTLVGNALVAGRIVVLSKGNGEKAREERERPSGLEFKGIVASATSTAMVLRDGSSFRIDQATEIKGTLAVGARVTVKATVVDGVLTARTVEVHEDGGGKGKNGDKDGGRKGNGQDRGKEKEDEGGKGKNGDKDGGRKGNGQDRGKEEKETPKDSGGQRQEGRRGGN